MRYHNITKVDMLNGDGLRVVLWTSGCSHCCQGCQNPLTWNPDSGIIFDESAKKEIFAQLELPYIDGITLSGGDPLHPNNIAKMTELVKAIHSQYPSKTIWLYTGFLWEDIASEEIIRYVDVVIDGKFEIDKLDKALKWKGSYNQRTIDAKKTLRCDKVILYNED